nr:DUF31 family protein [Mycoplasma nasistruthionis]
MTGLTKDIQLIHYNGETQVGAELDETDKVKSADIFRFDPSQVKIVYAGVNFLNSSPKDYLASDSPYKELEEMADIAILEFDFSNSTNKYVYERPNTTTNGVIRETIDNVYDYARYATADFANPESGLTSKPAPYDLYSKFDELNSQTLLADGKKVPLMRYNFVAVGFPVAYTDNFLRESKYQYDEGKKEALKITSSLWVNKPSKLRKDKTNSSWLGGGLSPNVAVRTFTDKPGLTDLLISNPIINDELKQGFEVRYLKEKESTYENNRYITYGLGYVTQAYQPGRGASGTALRDVNGNIFGAMFLSGDAKNVSLISIVQGLRSPGVDYQGLYGNYNLEQYDLIYGGGKNQRTSYREAMIKLYGNEYKTKLFPNGLATVPDEYKFKS